MLMTMVSMRTEMVNNDDTVGGEDGDGWRWTLREICTTIRTMRGMIVIMSMHTVLVTMSLMRMDGF